MSTRPKVGRSARAYAILTSVALVVGSATVLHASAAAPNFHAAGSAKQVYVTGVAPGARMSLLNAAGKAVKTKTANSLGGVLFRKVAPGGGYRVRRNSDGAQIGGAHRALREPAPWNPGVYKQPISDNGYQYLTTRDGTKLAINVHPPTSPAGLPGLPPDTHLPEGPAYMPPYPTLIEYSGYGYADPAGPTSGIAALANVMGFAVVDVNMRGTGCSGGAFDFFEPLQSLDGYDVIETIARQPWVKGHKVGMMGISYGGISQLFTARLRPPRLAAISPLSVIDATASTLYPGGVLNTGFAVAWADERQHEALPAGPDAGQPYAYQRIQEGDTTCAANQVLHGEAADLGAKIAANAHYKPAVADPLDPVTFVKKIDVPVFMSCQWEDEQTGGHCPELARHFTGTNKKWFTFTNGAHVDSLDPATFNRWYDFLQLYVAKEAPIANAALPRAAAPIVYQVAMGLPQTDLVTLPVDPIQLIPTYTGALAAFNQLPRGARAVRQRCRRGTARYGGRGRPVRRIRARLLEVADRAHGRAELVPRSPRNACRYAARDRRLQLVHCEPEGAAAHQSRTECRRRRAVGQRVAVAVELAAAPVGHGRLVRDGAAHVEHDGDRCRSGPAVGEVVGPRRRPPGHDQRGASRRKRDVRAERLASRSERKLATNSNNIFKRPSTTLEPIPTFRAADAAPMPANKYVKVVVPLYYQGHAYRAGSRIRVTISAPGGSQPVWAFASALPSSPAKVSIAFSKSRRRGSCCRSSRVSRCRRDCRRARACAISRAGRTRRR